MLTLSTLRRSAGLQALVAATLAIAAAPPVSANEVLKWNETTVRAAIAGGHNPIQQTRTVAMVQGAVHDALNAIKPRYVAYYYEGPAAAGASPEAAVAAASRAVLTGVIPSFGSAAQQSAAQAMLEEAYRTALAAIPDGQTKQDGIATGQAAGEAMLALRRDDGATRSASYTPTSAPGRWRPTPNPDPPNPPIADPKLAPGFAPANLPGWGEVRPFTLLSASQYWLPGPPALTSAKYASDFNEVKSVGGQVSTVRTPEQTEIARFWFEGPAAWYRVARAACDARSLDLWDSARALAVASLSMADAYIAGFKIRYVYDFWRPVTAIREAADDGNDATAADPAWNSLQNTPNVSDYPSTQSLFSGAAATALAAVLGTDEVAFTITSGPPFANIKRSFSSLSAAARESVDSRVYAGIHFRSACEDGLLLGRKVGQRAAATYLLPVKN
jgi:hypothetical protein